MPYRNPASFEAVFLGYNFGYNCGTVSPYSLKTVIPTVPKAAKTLTSREVNVITKVGLTALGGADGLYLSVKDSGTRSYVDRYRVRNTGRRTMIGLGSVADISLKDARAKAMELRKIVDHSICLSNFPILSPASANVSLNVPASLPDTVEAIA